MLTIDTHCHVGRVWFEPVEVLLFQMEQNHVDRAVLVQMYHEFDNSYLIECLRRFPGRFAAVGSIDPTEADAPAALVRLAKEGIQGIRLPLRDLPSMREPRVLLEAASRLEMVVSCIAPAAADFAGAGFHELVDKVPEVPIILEHLGAATPSWSPPYSAFTEVLALARYPNLHMKVPGFGELMLRPDPKRHPPFDLAEAPPLIDMAIDAFGANRLMIGSDWPPCSFREGYGNVIKNAREYLSRRPVPEQEAVLGGTAASLFRF